MHHNRDQQVSSTETPRLTASSRSSLPFLWKKDMPVSLRKYIQITLLFLLNKLTSVRSVEHDHKRHTGNYSGCVGKALDHKTFQTRRVSPTNPLID